MASTYSATLRLTEQATGSNVDTWGTVVNLVFGQIDQAVNGVLSLSVAGNANVTLAWPDGTSVANQANNPIIEFTGILTGNIKVYVPVSARQMYYSNATTGAFTLTVAVTGDPGTSVLIPQGSSLWLYTDGTNVTNALLNLGPLSTHGDMTVGGALSVAGSLSIATLTGPLTVNGAMTVTGGQLQANDSLSWALGAAGDLLNLSGAATLGGAVTMGSSATITGAVSLGSSATVTGALTASPGGAANEAVVWSQFGQATTAAGTRYSLPQGLYMQAGVGTTGGGGISVITFPTTFSDVPRVFATLLGPATDAFQIAADSVVAGSATMFGTSGGGGSSGIGFNWLAIGPQ